ncbi:MAG TPA: hypothetical protein VNY55_08035 [Mycobacterium sp.]|nr:hypothetical protein [Mycobacterium sp.]
MTTLTNPPLRTQMLFQAGPRGPGRSWHAAPRRAWTPIPCTPAHHIHAHTVESTHEQLNAAQLVGVVLLVGFVGRLAAFRRCTGSSREDRRACEWLRLSVSRRQGVSATAAH